MSSWVWDIEDMHQKFGVNEKVRQFAADKLKKFLEFRVAFLEEELNELKANMNNPCLVSFIFKLTFFEFC